MQQPLPPQSAPNYPADVPLFERYGHIIFIYIRKYALTREDAEDITSEVFTAALMQNDLNYLQPEAQLAWLKKVTRHKLVDNYRRLNRHITVNIDLFTEILYDNQEPEHILVQNEAHNQLRAYIQQLPSLQQQLLYLRYVHNLRCSEIGVLMNKSEAAVCQLLTRTRTALRTAYRNQDKKEIREC
jgi:RNA polymerase sigma-70 factor, ECF subfamily